MEQELLNKVVNIVEVNNMDELFDNLDRLRNLNYIIEFYGIFCARCKVLETHLQRSCANKYANVLKINVANDDLNDFIHGYNISTLPHIAIYTNNVMTQVCGYDEKYIDELMR
jgi:hypothetical protein